MNKFKCKKCHKVLLFYPDNINVSDDSCDSIDFSLKCPKCKVLNEIRLNKIEKEQNSESVI